MSHFTRVQTQLLLVQPLVEALQFMGLTVELHATPQPLYGFRGDARPETAEVIIRRRYVGASSNDIGFRRTENGSFEAIISEFDSRRYNQQWLDKLMQRYARNVVVGQVESMGYEWCEQNTDAGVLIQVRARARVLS